MAVEVRTYPGVVIPEKKSVTYPAKSQEASRKTREPLTPAEINRLVLKHRVLDAAYALVNAIFAPIRMVQDAPQEYVNSVRLMHGNKRI